jgi:hypothetical protein
MHAAVSNLPLWLDEGLAEYFEVPRGNGGLNRPHLQLLRDMMEHEGWQPNLARLEQFSSAEQMQQIDYAEAWGWAYYLLESDPDGREVLISYLAELREQGRGEPLSARIVARHPEPNRTLAKFLAALRDD